MKSEEIYLEFSDSVWPAMLVPEEVVRVVGALDNQEYNGNKDRPKCDQVPVIAQQCSVRCWGVVEGSRRHYLVE